MHRNFGNLHAYARRGEIPPLEERLRYKFQSTAVTERCTLLAARIFKATGAAGLSEDLPFGGILADQAARRDFLDRQIEGWQRRYARFITTEGDSEPILIPTDPPQAADFLLTIAGLMARRYALEAQTRAHG